jgi:hypothetical protein
VLRTDAYLTDCVPCSRADADAGAGAPDASCETAKTATLSAVDAAILQRVVQYSLILSQPPAPGLIPDEPINQVFRAKLNEAVAIARRAAGTAADTMHAANAILLESNLTMDDFIQWAMMRELSAP